MWIDEFVELMFGKNHNRVSMGIGVDLKYQNMPDLLYKYRSASDEHIDALENDYLYSSQVVHFNDPFECAISMPAEEISKNLYNKSYKLLRAENTFLPDRPVYSARDLLENITIGCGGSKEDIEKDPVSSALFHALTRIAEEKEAESLKEFMSSTQKMYNICSLSETFESLLMWAHYADSHKGFCAGYNIKGLNNDMTELTFPVFYRNDFHTIFDIEDINGSIGMYALNVKSIDWKYEKEWRVFFPTNDPPYKELMPTPKTVYLGAKISDDKKRRIVSICKKKGITVYQMNLATGKFRLIPSEVIY